MIENNSSSVMLKECAQIIRLHNNGLTVRSRRPVACAKCERGEGCGGGLVGRLLKNSEQEIFLPMAPDPAWRAGQAVELLIPASNVLQLAALAYGIPLLGLLAGALFANALYGGNGSVIAGAVIGLIAGMAVSKALLHRIRNGVRVAPIVSLNPPAG